MTIADHDIITTRYFFPRPGEPADIEYVDAGDARLACHRADFGHRVTVVHFHGNGEVVADYLPGFAHHLDELGANAFFAEYRGYGGSTGTPRLAAMLDDVDAIHDAVGRPDHQIIAFGRSIGSIYAIEFASRHPDIAGLVIESGIADVLERILVRAEPTTLGATREQMEQQFDQLFDHRAKLADYPGPTLVMHALHDHLVDHSHAERLTQWAGERAQLVTFDEGNHNTIFPRNRDAYLAHLGEFIDQVEV